MSRGSSSTGNDDSLEKLTNKQISSLDGEEDEEYTFDDDDEDDEEDDDEEQEAVMLGFIEKPKHEWSLLRHLFPSKAGGTPAWLDPINLPYGKSCLCDICGEPLRFLLQVYAPVTDKESTFHRTLFVFMCPSMSCLLQDQHGQWKHHPEKGPRSIKVFRCQFARNNQFYSSESPKNNGHDKPLGPAAPLCSWCGTWKGDKVCSNCKKARYCSKLHQTSHWSSAHKSQCRMVDLLLPVSNSGSTNCSEDIIPKAAINIAWPEYEIINEEESEFDLEMTNSNAYGKALPTNNEDEGDAKSWACFQKRIARAPDQVIRYSRCSKPLWPMLSGQPSKDDIPKCSSCGSHRVFEFQIMPQLLYFFDVKNDSDSLDWATIVVYTCEASCDGRLAYEEEFAWVQHAFQSR